MFITFLKKNCRAGKLKCILWDKYVEEVSNFVEEKYSGSIILLIQFAKFN